MCQIWNKLTKNKINVTSWSLYSEIQSKYLSREWLYGNTSDDLCHADCKIFVDEQPFNKRSFWCQYDWSAESYCEEGIIVSRDNN